MTTMRVYLHNLLWEDDAEGLKTRMNVFLDIAAKHHIKPLFVLFDSCWDPNPKLGPQHPPIPGVPNSGWVPAPGAARLADKRSDAHRVGKECVRTCTARRSQSPLTKKNSRTG